MEPDGIRNAGCSTADLQDFSFSLYLSWERKKKKEIISKSKIGRICFLKKAIVELYETVGQLR